MGFSAARSVRSIQVALLVAGLAGPGTTAQAQTLKPQAAGSFEQQAADRPQTAAVPRAGAAVGSYNQAVWPTPEGSSRRVRPPS
jgi:hypothetical protein